MDSHRYKILYKEGEAEISEKKSRFIAHIAPAQTEEEAQAFVEKIKKQYWDARHNCWAYSIGEKQPALRCSDDGEPSRQTYAGSINRTGDSQCSCSSNKILWRNTPWNRRIDPCIHKKHARRNSK